MQRKNPFLQENGHHGCQKRCNGYAIIPIVINDFHKILHRIEHPTIKLYPYKKSMLIDDLECDHITFARFC